LKLETTLISDLRRKTEMFDISESRSILAIGQMGRAILQVYTALLRM